MIDDIHTYTSEQLESMQEDINTFTSLVHVYRVALWEVYSDCFPERSRPNGRGDSQLKVLGQFLVNDPYLSMCRTLSEEINYELKKRKANLPEYPEMPGWMRQLTNS